MKTGEFGNEGSGGQSYRVYNWKAGHKYRFLLGAKPSDNNSTDYTAYFFAPEIGKWELIASFRRPKTTTYVTHPYSFLENFMTEMGQFTRKATYRNQWLRNTDVTDIGLSHLQGLSSLESLGFDVKVAVRPSGQARSGWKILRRLGAELELDGFSQVDMTSLREEMLGEINQSGTSTGEVELASPKPKGDRFWRFIQ